MWRFITSILLLISPLMMQGQLFQELEEGRSPFVRISIDPTVSLKTFLQEANMFGFEATIDSEIKQNLLLMGGVGFITTDLVEPTYSYNSSGVFGVVGADLNLTKYVSPTDRDIFFVGLHYGFSSLSHEASGILIENYWGDYKASVSREMHTASWVELAFGIKAELAKNVFIGWTSEVKFRTHVSSGEMIPYNIPGYGKNDSKVSFDLGVFLSYAFTMKPKQGPTNIEPLE